jgi:glycosyltransferase involved in cell wall biosynthesis
MKFKKILIIQNLIRHYRIPLYKILGAKYHLTVCHSGDLLNNDEINFKNVHMTCKEFWKFKYQQNLASYIKENDVIILMFDIQWLSSLKLFFGNTNKPIILWGHGLGRSSIGNKLRKWFVQRADALLLYDESAEKDFADCDVRKIFVANNTVHVPNSFYNTEADRNTLLFVGRLQPRKGLEMLIEAFANIVNDIPPKIKLVFVGEGPSRPVLEKMSKSFGLEFRIEYTGAITNPVKLKDIFDASIAYVSPGHVGLGVLHSFAYGVPVITMKYKDHAPEVNNINDGANGYLCMDFDDLCRRIKEICNNKKLAESMGKAAYVHYRDQRTMQHMVEGFTQAIEFVTR